MNGSHLGSIKNTLLCKFYLRPIEWEPWAVGSKSWYFYKVPGLKAIATRVFLNCECPQLKTLQHFSFPVDSCPHALRLLCRSGPWGTCSLESSHPPAFPLPAAQWKHLCLPWQAFLCTGLFSAESACFPLSVRWLLHGESSESNISS